MTSCLVNLCTTVREKLRCDTLDMLFEVLVMFMALLQVHSTAARKPKAITFVTCCVQGPCSLWKADINAAYKRIPLLPAHRQFARVVHATVRGMMTAQHYSMPFGAIAAVHAWDRIGAQEPFACAFL